MYAEKYPKVKGIYMANWTQGQRCVEDEWNEVQRICDQLQIPCERVNFEKEYWVHVFEPMIEMYRAGLTPNPDVGCNKYVKFGAMIEHLQQRCANLEKWWLVTGHYSRILKEEDHFRLLRSSYKPKDQSYYLLTILQKSMLNLLLPLGHMTKPQVRELASLRYQLPNAAKKDSMGLCFVSQEGPFLDFLSEYIADEPGNIVTDSGEVLGRHRGLWHGTIGQRLRIPVNQKTHPGAWFFAEKRLETNELVVVSGTTNPRLYSDIVEVEDWVWLVPGDTFDKVRQKYGKLTLQDRTIQEPLECILVENLGSKLMFTMEKGRRGVSPGQNLVMYAGDIVLGCGIITGLRRTTQGKLEK